ncbi:hypothetical protein ACPEEZ_01050 [Frigoribacterium sp. 2-23]|uniref:hypothetical protein n=1 Tax=Frigoribacterium sp. 2-23 TaxID=3415006 RepID=UPI003C6EEA91
MNDVILPAVMWAVVICCAFPRRRGRDLSVLLAGLFMALSFTVTAGPVYRAVEHLTGDVNVTDLIKHTLFVVAVTFLARAILRAVGPASFARGSRLRRFGALVPLGVLVVQTVAFVAIDRSAGSTTSFMLEFGDQPAAMVYSMAHFVYFGVTLGAVGFACVHSGYQSAPTFVRVGIRFLIAGCAVSVVTAALLVVRDATRVAGLREFSDTLQQGYAPLLLASVLLVALGLGLPPVLGGSTRRQLARQLPELTVGLERMRDRASGDRVSLRFPSGTRMPGDEATPLDEVHRLVVEVRDQMFLNPAFVPTDDEQRVLARSERLVGRLELL